MHSCHSASGAHGQLPTQSGNPQVDVVRHKADLQDLRTNWVRWTGDIELTCNFLSTSSFEWLHVTIAKLK